MRITVTLQIASANLSLDKLEEVVSYTADNLVSKGQDRVPPRPVPKANGWNGGLVLTDVRDTDEATRACLDRYPQIAERVRALRQISSDIECRLYLGLRPFCNDFVLLFEGETIRRLGELECQLSIEYFDD
jgi:hypothetical protein